MTTRACGPRPSRRTSCVASTTISSMAWWLLWIQLLLLHTPQLLSCCKAWAGSEGWTHRRSARSGAAAAVLANAASTSSPCVVVTPDSMARASSLVSLTSTCDLTMGRLAVRECAAGRKISFRKVTQRRYPRSPGPNLGSGIQGWYERPGWLLVLNKCFAVTNCYWFLALLWLTKPEDFFPYGGWGWGVSIVFILFTFFSAFGNYRCLNRYASNSC
jgi:hypothetical protein